MKKWMPLLLILLMLSGCGSLKPKQTVTFYYPRLEYDYRAADSVIGREQRDMTGHSTELRYLLDIYLLGPSDEKLVSPFPSHTKVISLEDGEEGLTITLSDLATISDSRFTLGSYCLASLCSQLGEENSITIISGSRSLTLGLSDFTTQDHGFQNEQSDNGGKK